MGTPSITISTLFDALPIDTVSIIVKRIASHSPNFKAGDEQMHDMLNTSAPVRCLALLFSEKSPFRAAAATLVSQIELHWPNPRSSIDASTNLLNIGLDLFHGEAMELDLARKIFSECGPHVRKISMRKVPQEEEIPKAFVQLFTSFVFVYCPNVREIAFCEYRAPLTKWEAASSLFREYAANLRKIEWHGEEDMNGFPHLRKCVHLRFLKSRGLNTATLVSLLEACGPALQELDISITPVVDRVEVMDAIRKYCKQLSVIIIENVEDVLDVVGEERYSSLLCSFGSQLKNADTKGLGHEHLMKVVDACPILEVTAVWDGMGSVTA